MNRAYLARLDAIWKEYSACLQALRYVLNYDDLSASLEIADVTRKQFVTSIEQLEGTYLVRLFAEYEGILKDHLREHHSYIKFDDKAVKVDWLLSKLLRQERIVLHPALRSKVSAIRDYP